ncbi:MAG: glyceraldehyde-3-phosphate dehydrogenase (phosphorylating) [Candidatus Bathyarchaeota archaeon B24]|nr:MAG: glyceraldehyde-3-phosphate dehydrogenase (phosphorylating) [Candidatus Bathyarchaeota archaeon B24]RLI25318.1 MAG: type II glyceraldehyde-3-phosphate dehydrogenase [Candidatus Bathyarchaeota archaeon]
MGKVKVLVNGYGVIGKRVADAVALQDDMELVGIADVVGDWRVKMAQRKGYTVYCSVSDPKRVEDMKKAGIDVHGTLEDLLKNGALDVVVDCAPGGFGAKNKEALYDKYGVKAIFEGGEKHEVAGLSFVCQCNYDEALEKAEAGHRYARVVSCNTTAACRIFHALYTNFKVSKARMFLVRRATDPVKTDTRGIMNTVVPSTFPSHHAPDVKTVIHDAIPDLYSVAVKAAHTMYHFHLYDIHLEQAVTREDIIEALNKEPRLSLVRMSDGVIGLGAVIEISRDVGLPRGDIYTIPVWEDLVTVIEGKEVLLAAACPNENDVIPENVDAIRALTLIEKDWKRSLEKTDKTLRIPKVLY